MTYAEAKAIHLQNLAALGWTVKPNLKVPHATSRDGQVRLWFKPQAVWASYGVGHELGNARSIFVDTKTANTQQIITAARR